MVAETVAIARIEPLDSGTQTPVTIEEFLYSSSRIKAASKAGSTYLGFVVRELSN